MNTNKVKKIFFLNIFVKKSNMTTEKNVKLENWENVLNANFSAPTMSFDLIKYPVITEKSYISLFKNRQYTFDVDMRLTKPQIKKLFEKLLNVNIISINTHIPPRKKQRVGVTKGYRPQYKRVIVTLQEGQSINFN